MSITETTTPTFVVLDPNKVGVHPNVRHDLGDMKGLTKSVKELGVLVPVVVVPGEDGGHLVVIGQRRHGAALEAGRDLPAIVGHDVDDAQRIARQLAENLHRKDLTPSEEGKAFEQLALLGLSDTAIAKTVGVPKDRVAKARTVARSEVARAVVDRYALTLEQGLVLAEFDDDKAAVKELTVVALKDPGQFEHLVSELRQERELAEALAASVAALTEAGVTVLESAGEVPEARELWRLTDGDSDTPLTPETHAGCPGRAAVVREHDPRRPTFYCIDPDAHGHRDLYAHRANPSSSGSGPMSEEQKAERRVVLVNNKKWRAAEPVRRKYVTALVTRKSAPKGTLRYVATEVLSTPGRLGDANDILLAELLGAKPPRGGRRVGEAYVERATEAQLPLTLVAQVAAAIEQSMDVNTWRRHKPIREARYLIFLASTGYTLSEVEQFVVDLAFPKATTKRGSKQAPTAEAAGEADPDADVDTVVDAADAA